MTDQRWTLVLKDPDDPYRHSAHAVQRNATRWDVDYLRGDEVDSTATISTPPPHMPPMATLMGTLQELHDEAEYWARRDAAATSPKERP